MMQYYDVAILGAGISGLIQAVMIQRQHPTMSVVVLEALAEIPPTRIHYIHSDIRHLLPMVEMREVDVVSNVYWQGRFHSSATVEMMNMFSFTTTTTVFQNSMKFIDGRARKVYIPVDGMEKFGNALLAELDCPVLADKMVVKIKDVDKRKVIGCADGTVYDVGQIVSTIALPTLLKILGDEDAAKFQTSPVHVGEVTLPETVCRDVYQVVYIPEGLFGVARVSILGSRLTTEQSNGRNCRMETEKEREYGLNGFLQQLLPNVWTVDMMRTMSVNGYGRYVPVDEGYRLGKMAVLQKQHIFCLGRYAEWAYRRVDHVTQRALEFAQVWL